MNSATPIASCPPACRERPIQTGPEPAVGHAEAISPLDYFGDMIDHCCDFAEAAKAQGRPVVGIMCEFTPREIILAAGAVPVCLCGGSAATIPAAEQVSARQPVSADQIHLRLPRHREESVS